MSISFVRHLAKFFIVAPLSCSATNPAHEGRTSPDTTVIVDYELNRVEFQPGRPLPGESFEDSAKSPSTSQVLLLEKNADFLRGTPADLGTEVIGSTDNLECAGPKCRELSLRRAKCVRKWLVDHGVPASKFRGLKGDGADYPIGDNNTETGRQQNRRVQFELLPLK